VRLFTIISDRNTSKGVRRVPLSDSRMAERQRDKTKSEEAIEHFSRPAKTKCFHSKATKATKKEIYCLWISEAFVALLNSLPSPLCFPPLGDLAVRLPVAPNGLVLIECRVQLFNGDVAGYSE
jgi:hypothetical protein